MTLGHLAKLAPADPAFGKRPTVAMCLAAITKGAGSAYATLDTKSGDEVIDDSSYF
ncbi:hypothetical protein [Singulisphaera acidiphila]|uniref:Uncharacterized protein n=1 Tax=Singulisphaera acidiphila (strain ATCC BAA-1392 / DSM 18658 / VKM B-2454 / MOB10) TaxID=886293 RepID=L0DQP9_SINAD|nr:hypothetical protein [Singulisphaera acidiphila]AGA31303.1 hypothetical protein Sinac_7261 [Singulisphaera acidiphila DSM 18658]